MFVRLVKRQQWGRVHSALVTLSGHLFQQNFGLKTKVSLNLDFPSSKM